MARLGRSIAGLGMSLAMYAVLLYSLLLLDGCSRYVLTRADLGVLDASRAPVTVRNGDEIRFVVFGDSRSRNALDYPAESELRTCRSRLARVVAGENVDFVINTGDMVRNGDKQLWDYFAEDTGELIKPRFFFPCWAITNTRTIPVSATTSRCSSPSSASFAAMPLRMATPT